MTTPVTRPSARVEAGDPRRPRRSWRRPCGRPWPATCTRRPGWRGPRRRRGSRRGCRRSWRTATSRRPRRRRSRGPRRRSRGRRRPRGAAPRAAAEWSPARCARSDGTRSTGPVSCLEPGVEVTRVAAHPQRRLVGHAGRGDEPGGVPGRPRGQLVALEQQDVAPAQLGQVVGDAGADHAAADDDDLGAGREVAASSQQRGCGGGSEGAAGASVEESVLWGRRSWTESSFKICLRVARSAVVAKRSSPPLPRPTTCGGRSVDEGVVEVSAEQVTAAVAPVADGPRVAPLAPLARGLLRPAVRGLRGVRDLDDSRRPARARLQPDPRRNPEQPRVRAERGAVLPAGPPGDVLPLELAHSRASASRCTGFGNIYWTIFIRPMDPQPFPSVADGFWLSFYPLRLHRAVAGHSRDRGERVPLSLWLDGIVGGLAVAAVAAAVVGPVLKAVHANGDSTAAIVTTEAYPLLDVLLLLVVTALLALYHWRPPAGMWFLAGGLGAVRGGRRSVSSGRRTTHLPARRSRRHDVGAGHAADGLRARVVRSRPAVRAAGLGAARHPRGRHPVRGRAARLRPRARCCTRSPWHSPQRPSSPRSADSSSASAKSRRWRTAISSRSPTN